MGTNSGPSEILICSQINLLLTISNAPPHPSVRSLLNAVYPYAKNSLLLIPWGKWLSEPITISVSLSRNNTSIWSYFFRRLWKLAVNMRKLFALQQTGYWLMDETEKIDEFVVSNNWLVILGEDRNYSITIPLSCYRDMPQI